LSKHKVNVKKNNWGEMDITMREALFPFKGPYVKMWQKRYLHIMKILSSMYIYLK
jgi:hypothetical protein